MFLIILFLKGVFIFNRFSCGQHWIYCLFPLLLISWTTAVLIILFEFQNKSLHFVTQYGASETLIYSPKFPRDFFGNQAQLKWDLFAPFVEFHTPFLPLTYLFLLCMYECFACIYECVLYAVHAIPWKGQKRVSDPLKFELQMVVSHHINVGNWTRVLYESNGCS